MRYLLLILFVSTVLTEEQIAKNADKKIEDKNELKKSIEEPKSKTEKRDSSDQTGSFSLNPNDEPFKPIINSPAPFAAAASDAQRVYYDKHHVTTGEGAGSAKVAANPQAESAYRGQYSQVAQQQQQQHQQQHSKGNHLKANAKNVVVQQQQQQQHQNQPSILYAVPQNPAYHYENIPQQQNQQQQQQLQLPIPPPLPLQRGQQKQIQYIIAIPMSYLRQLQQQVLYQQQQQQQEQPSQMQSYKGQQQPQYQQVPQLQAVPVYSIAGPLARDHHGSYRPFHRLAAPAVNDVSTTTIANQQQQTGPSNSPAPPGYAAQYIQIPANALLAAMQTAQVQLQQRPVHLSQQPYQQQPQPQPQPQQIHIQPIQIQQQQQQQPPIQAQSPQFYYYQSQQQQQQQLQQQVQQQQYLQPQQQQYLQPQQQQQQQPQPIQLKQSQLSHALTSPPIYGYHINQHQPPLQQHQNFEHLIEQQHQQQLQQQLNVGKQTHRFQGVRPMANLAPTQNYGSTAEAYESEEKAQLVTLPSPVHINVNAPHTFTDAHNQQYLAQATAQRQPQAASPEHQVVEIQTPQPYEHVARYNPPYIQHHPEQHQHQHQHPQPYQQRQPQPQPHRLRINPQQHLSFTEYLNNLPYSQGIHSRTALLFSRHHASAGEVPSYNLNAAMPPSFIPSAFQPSYSPLGTPSKVTSFTNVLLQPFVGHSASYQAPEIGTAAAGSAESSNGIRYGTHLYHPPTSAYTAGNSPAGHPDPRALTVPPAATKVTASSVKASVVGSPTLVKYP